MGPIPNFAKMLEEDIKNEKAVNEKINRAVDILYDANKRGGNANKHARAASIYSKAVCEVIDILEDLQD